MHDPIRRGITLLRHGQIEGAPALYGRSDPPLTADALHAYAPLLQAPAGPWQRVLCSPRTRSRQVGSLLTEHFDIPLDIWPELAEMDFGQWDGVPYADLVTQWPHLERFWADPVANPLPGAEPLADFHRRVLQAWEQMLQINRAESLLVVTHGGVIRMLLAHLLHADWQRGEFYQCLTIPYASMTQLEVWHGDGLPAIQIRQLGSLLTEPMKPSFLDAQRP